jgi:hypothetical protein
MWLYLNHIDRLVIERNSWVLFSYIKDNDFFSHIEVLGELSYAKEIT